MLAPQEAALPCHATTQVQGTQIYNKEMLAENHALSFQSKRAPRTVTDGWTLGFMT